MKGAKTMKIINKQTSPYILIILIPLLCWLIFGFVFKLAYINGDSMEPTLHDGGLLIGNKLFKGPVERGDIVVVQRPGKIIIKRVIGIEGDTINIDSRTGEVYLNGTVLDEPYLSENTIHSGIFDMPLTVPDGHIYILGDNRAESLDSRYIGTVPASDVICKMMFRIY
jgi:signal peptidase I